MEPLSTGMHFLGRLEASVVLGLLPIFAGGASIAVLMGTRRRATCGTFDQDERR